MRFPRGKWIRFAVIYLTWQVAFSVAVSPLGFKILSAKQMGFTIGTVWLGLLVAFVVLTITTLLARTSLAYGLYSKGLSYIKTKEEFDKFWTTSLRGCDDGIIAETHWSGAVLPLFMLGFAAIGIPFPFNAIPAMIARWATHVGAHVLFPKEKSGERMFGGMNFIAKGLAYEDTVASISFLLSGNIIAPVLLHHLGAYISTFAGNKERIAKHLGV
ncbi:MAG TPA: hypothetical protein VLU95_00030 [Candidatus Acidoferrum sp.]|nr:hypothetical protein [Candidatus Acidoferrum sp.]